MLAYVRRPARTSFCDRFPYIEPCYARGDDRRKLSTACATAIIAQTGSLAAVRFVQE